MSDNYSEISLKTHIKILRTKVANIRKSMGMLENKKSDFYEHHQNLINAYNEMISVADNFIDNSNYIGKGR